MVFIILNVSPHTAGSDFELRNLNLTCPGSESLSESVSGKQGTIPDPMSSSVLFRLIHAVTSLVQ